MSQTEDNTQTSQRHEQLPIVPTKAKMNSALGRGTASEFGMESMFQSSRTQHQSLADEDAPPTTSVNDFMNALQSNPSNSNSLSLSKYSTSPFGSTRATDTSTSQPNTQKDPVYVIVFGYPPDKYSTTVSYFSSLGACTAPDPSTEISNCFRIGYPGAAEAMRAVRKSGEVLGGSWMVGVKWADPAQAETLLGQSVRSGVTWSPPPPTGAPDEMAVDSPLPPSSPSSRALVTQTLTVGTPVRLAPSAAAFKKPGTPAANTPGAIGGPATAAAQANASPNKSMLGQVSDLIFGW
ncbi:hypothetical protein PUNSTDRAFT_54314 [Punctularia strigosozonata HHB-11173 SS5]|uniref:uncharacterized protein n=1 Tax=Punctularia strigosozonata (strain HHB-11173) TaxID=741275 RepID=UPI00044179A8|nr:uncharacterized protein PUNSTDRAFT_54314 [Punctularia strigosozonata HHB-11173 SS5]EIN06016.1 hypothetical protein PUNSTDRAFT_54314 [Punctularia strigosozonata HHB-11173 SS5]